MATVAETLEMLTALRAALDSLDDAEREEVSARLESVGCADMASFVRRTPQTPLPGRETEKLLEEQ